MEADFSNLTVALLQHAFGFAATFFHLLFEQSFCFNRDPAQLASLKRVIIRELDLNY